MPRSNPASARVLWCLPAGVSAAPARPPCADGGAARNRLGKQRYACYCAAQVMGAIFGALALKLALPPAMDETPFTTTGSLTFSHPFQVRDERRRTFPHPARAVRVRSLTADARTRARFSSWSLSAHLRWCTAFSPLPWTNREVRCPTLWCCGAARAVVGQVCR